MLKKIRDFFGVGRLTAVSENYVQYWVGALEDILVNHFDKYPLITQKWSDYQLFKQAVELVVRKEHLTPEGLQKIVSIRAVLNKGLSEDLRAAFPGVVPSIRPQVQNRTIPDPYWVSGFVDAEGCFNVRFTKTTDPPLGGCRGKKVNQLISPRVYYIMITLLYNKRRAPTHVVWRVQKGRGA